MNIFKRFALAFICVCGIGSTAHADDWWWHRHHHHGYVVVAPGPVVGIDIGFRNGYYRVHHRSLEVDVQLALARRGYYRGPIDGDIGAGSSAAIREYQYDRGIPVTGVIDGPLIRSLGL